jgi:hypothetical protein
MIYVLEIPEASLPRAWFAFDDEDLLRKAAPLAGAGDTRYVYWDEAEAVGAFEGGDTRIAGPAHWRARRALYAQLVALDVLADDN